MKKKKNEKRKRNAMKEKEMRRNTTQHPKIKEGKKKKRCSIQQPYALNKTTSPHHN
jgi:hypothetical protein